MSEARAHHYDFAHRALPQIAFSAGARFREDIERNASAVVADIWRFVGRRLREAGVPTLDELPPPTATRVGTDAGTAWIITLPPPAATVEAALCALVFGDGPTPDEQVRYFTLERTVDFASQSTAHVLCWWTADGTHHNSGAYVEPTVDAFAAALAGHLGRGA